MMEQTVKQRRSQCAVVVEDFRPNLERPIRRDDDRAAFVPEPNPTVDQKSV
jgi:hypothetical protein